MVICGYWIAHCRLRFKVANLASVFFFKNLCSIFGRLMAIENGWLDSIVIDKENPRKYQELINIMPWLWYESNPFYVELA